MFVAVCEMWLKSEMSDNQNIISTDDSLQWLFSVASREVEIEVGDAFEDVRQASSAKPVLSLANCAELCRGHRAIEYYSDICCL